MASHARIRRVSAGVAVSVALVSASVTPAYAGDQKIVDKGIGFLSSIRSQSRHMSCSGIARELASRDINVPTTRSDFEAGIEADAQSRRDHIEKVSGGMTARQRQDLEDEIDKTRPVVIEAAERCHFFDLKPPEEKKPATTPAPDNSSTNKPARPAVTTTTDDDDSSDTSNQEVTPTVQNTTTTPSTTGTSETKDSSPDLTAQLATINNNLAALNNTTTSPNQSPTQTPAQAADKPQQAPAPAARAFTQVVIPNPLDAAHPFVVFIPPFITPDMVARFSQQLPPGWKLQ